MLFLLQGTHKGQQTFFYMPNSWTHWMVKSVREVDSDILGRFGDPRWSCGRRFRGEVSQLIVMVTNMDPPFDR